MMTDPELFEIVDIGGPLLKPKEFSPKMTCCVRRKQNVDKILRRLEEAAADYSFPGVYLSGPAGAGKSVLAYMITQIYKFEKSWLTIYIPDCRAWAEINNSNEAKGFFLDRVLDALSTETMQEHFPMTYAKLNNPPDLGYKPPTGETWAYVAQHQNVNDVYYMVKAALVTSKVNVLFVCDEVNALWEAKECHQDEPWNLTRFYPTFLRKGALFLTGTTDYDYVGSIPTGLEKHVYTIGKCSDAEIDMMKNLDGYEILRDIEILDADKWHSIADATGNIPRELRLYVDAASQLDLGKRVHDFLEKDYTDEPAKKKAKKEIILEDLNQSIAHWRANNVRRHEGMLDHVLKSQRKNPVFIDALFGACESIFLKGRAARTRNEVLRVANFVVTPAGMYPTTADAQKVLFDWFRKEERKRCQMESSVADLLQRFLEAPIGRDRGNAFGDYLAAKLTVLGGQSDSKLMFHHLTNDDLTQHELPLYVSERVFASADSPPRNFQHFAQNTLLTHVDLKGAGEAPVGLIHYRKDRVIYIEAAVGNYLLDTKIPTESGEKGRQELILQTLTKWLGKDVFDVKVVPTPADGKQLISATKQLSVEYLAKSNKDRPALPEIHYIVVTTCPQSLLPTQSRMNKYSWIKVCYLEDLISANIIPGDYKARILGQQAEGARLSFVQ